MSNELRIFKNELFEVEVKLEDGTIMFDAEKVVRCLGFVSKTVKNGVTYENVRWSRVNSFLPQVAELEKGSLIPESMVYKLAFKASNEIAEKFQDWLAIEVIPSIRKHGAYMTPETIEQVLMNPDTIIQLATNLKIEQEKRKLAEQKVEEQKPLVSFAEKCIKTDDSILVRELSKIIQEQGINVGEKKLYKKLREWGLILQSKTEPSQRGMDLELFEVIQRPINTPYGERLEHTTKVTPKGQVYIIEKLNKEMNISK